MLGILANHHHAAFALDNLALFADRLNRRTYFHNIHTFLVRGARNAAASAERARFPLGSVLAAPGDPASGQIIGREFNRHLVPGVNPDEVHPHFAGNVGQNLMAVLKFHLEHGIRQSFNHFTFHFDHVTL